MIFLLASLALLFITPLIVLAVQRYRRVSQILVFILMLGISYNIFRHIILENMEAFGWGAVAAALAGVLLLGMGDDFFFSQPERRSKLFLVTVQVFLFLHAMIDGAALVSSDLPLVPGMWPEHSHAGELSVSILMHRMLFEVFIWKYFLDRHGRWAALVVLINVGCGTIIGFFGSKALFALIPNYFGLFEAFVGGALLHLVYDYFKDKILPKGASHQSGPSLLK